MNKFSLLLMSLIIVGNLVAGEAASIASEGQGSQVAPTEVVSNVNQAPVKFTEQVIPGPALKEGDKESLSVSKLEAIKAFFAHGLIKVQGGASFAKYYLLGDFLTKYLVDKGYISDADKALLTSYVTPKLLINYAAVVAVVNVVYFGYRALASSNQDEDDFMLEDEEDFE